MLSKLDETQSFAYAINSATMATSDTISVNVFSTWPLSTQKQARDIYNRYEKIIEQSDLIKKIEHEIIRLNLNSSWNTELTILELLQKSKNAFEIPSDPDVSASGVLIPLRESINQILSELLRNRPTQEKTRGYHDKIYSICKQCCFSNVDSRLIEQLADKAAELQNRLSDSKKSVMTRDQVRELQNEGMLFIYSFLSILDENV